MLYNPCFIYCNINTLTKKNIVFDDVHELDEAVITVGTNIIHKSIPMF